VLGLLLLWGIKVTLDHHLEIRIPAPALPIAALLLLGIAFRSRIKFRPPDLPALFAVGVLDVGADVFFAFATTIGLLSVVSILSSLYPVATVVLARIVLDERMARLQQAGILLAFAGVVLISV